VTLTRIAHSFVLAYGWRRAGIAFLAGAISALAMAPFNAWPVLFITFPVLVWLLDGTASGRWSGAFAAAGVGWCFGFGYFVAGLYWIGYAFLVDAKTFGWLLPIAVSGLPAYLALFTALGLAAARLIWVRGAERVLALAAMLTIAEWLRGHLLSGFPWNTFGYALAQPLALAQSVSLVGVWGLTFLSILIFASPAVLTDEKVDTPHPRALLIVGLIILAAFTGYGALRLWQSPTGYVDGVKLRIMQPDLQQDAKFNYSAKQEVMARYLRLSNRSTGPQANGVHDVTHLIWPESAFPFFLAREPDALAQITALLQPHTVLITGAVRAAPAAANGHIVHAYNSVYVIDHDGSILGIYDKVHLVPFGEYLPFQHLLERLGLQQLTKMTGGFLAGDRRRAMDVPGAPKMLPLICYEAIFPGTAVPRDQRPGWLVNVTNDGWFGISTGPYQHFEQARMLAIAEGLPLVRAANTGISAVIDPLGRIVRSLPLGAEGVLDANLPRAVAPPPYVRIGDFPLILFLVVSFLVVGRRRFHS
jgi:apolipoprotein N-acyltransferase